MAGYGIYFLAAAVAVFVVGFAGLTVGEVVLLKRKRWTDEKSSLRYPVVTNLVNVPVAAVALIVCVWVLFATAMLVVGYFEFTYRTSNPALVDAVVIAFYILAVVIPFFVFMATFSIVRFITTSAIAKNSGLSWKYALGQSALLAVVTTLASALLIATLYS